MQNRQFLIIVLVVAIGVIVGSGLFLFWKFQQSEAIEISAPSVDSEPPTIPTEGDPSATITFSADFSNNNGCDGHSNRGCDIYTATIEFDGSVSNIVQYTSDDISETWPVFSTDGATIYANADQGVLRGNIEWVSLANQTHGVLQANARGTAPSPDGKSFFFIKLDGTSALMKADFVSATLLADAVQISSAGQKYGEPHMSPLGDIVFHQLFDGGRGSNTAQGGVYRSSTGDFIHITEANGSAHCFWGFDGTSAYCNNVDVYPGILKIQFENGILGTPIGTIHHPRVADVAALDADYAACVNVQYAYGSFCDEDHLIVTLGCATRVDGVATTTMSKLALLDLSSGTPIYIPLGKNLAAAFGGPGSSSYTATCK